MPVCFYLVVVCTNNINTQKETKLSIYNSSLSINITAKRTECIVCFPLNLFSYRHQFTLQVTTFQQVPYQIFIMCINDI
jgi:hypothetical protein